MTMPARLTAATVGAAASVALLLSGCTADTAAPAVAWLPATAPPDALAHYAGSASSDAPGLDQLIASLTVVDALPAVPGYDRSCSPGDGCVFGPAWTDDSGAPLARNGCDTRNDVLGKALENPVFKPGTRDCKVLSGTLNDPYTGQTIPFTSGRDTSSAVAVDHIYPLSRAYDAGAATWDQNRRNTFANDVELNLRATSGRVNSSKSDSGPDTWLPPNTDYQCQYTIDYLTVAAAYQLAVTTGDVDAARTACSGVAS